MKFISDISCALVLLIVSQLCLAYCQPFDYPTANLATTWTNHVSAPHSVTFSDGSTRSIVRAILLRGALGPKYACGFFCNGNCDKYIFAVFIVQTNSGGGIVMPAIGFPQVVWSANRNHPVSLNSTLQLTSDGDLVLKDVDGVIAWSTKTSGKSVIGMNMTDIGNLVLFDSKVSKIGLRAVIEADPPQAYYQSVISGKKTSKGPSYIKLMNGSLAIYILDKEPNDPNMRLTIPQASSAQYMKLEGDRHLRVYEWAKGPRGGWGTVADLLTGYLGVCNYPTVCGKYGICFNGECSCPAATKSGTTRFFEPVSDRQPSLGCRETAPLRCNASRYHEFLELKDITYFAFKSDIKGTNMEKCKKACLRKCSCKGAFFRYGTNSAVGDCYLPSQIFSLMNNDKELTHYNSTAFIKIQGSGRKVL
ncbi:hypothetical protein QQ045_027437 [Rhodiola kirilowii]